MVTLEELNEHYKAVRARLNSPPIMKREPPAPTLHSGPYPDPLDSPPPVKAPKQEVPAEAPPVTAETPARRVLSEVADKHGMPSTVFRSQSRDAAYVLCRQEAAYRLKYELNFSLSQIGRLMGHRDHTTVLHAIRRYEKNLALGQEPRASKCVSNACATQVELTGAT